jgi:hypothetical protein
MIVERGFYKYWLYYNKIPLRINLYYNIINEMIFWGEIPKAMSIIEKLKDLGEYKAHYLDENEQFQMRKLRYIQTSNSTTSFLREEFNYEQRKKIIKHLELTGCPLTHIETIKKMHEEIYKEFQDSFEQHDGKTAIFDFCNLVEIATSLSEQHLTSTVQKKVFGRK